MRLPLVLAGLLFAASAHAAVLEVEGPQDSLAGPPTINHCTLRKAVRNANLNGMASPHPQCLAGSPGVDTINFLFPGTITFALAGIMEEDAATGDLDIIDDLIINGHPDGTIIDGADLDRIFDVKPGVSLTLNDITIRNGRGLGSGGGIYVNGGTLTLNRVTITSCLGDEGDGGAIYADNGSTLVINHSTISGNTADHIAGGIIISGGTAAVTNTTITGNSSGFSNLPGGISQGGASFTLRNTIVAGNGGVDSPNIAGTVTSLGYNIVGSYGTNPPTIAPAVGDQLNVADALVLLGPLASNGGPTQTHALTPGSIALDKGHSSGASTDQRGLTRPCDDGGITNASGGDGGDVGAFERQVACAAGPPDAIDDNFAVNEDSGANVFDVLANDTGDSLSITSVTQGMNGSVTFTAASVTYTPNANFHGNDSFTYTVTDSNAASDTATVFVVVSNVNDAPVATADAYAMDQDTVLNIAAPGVLGNDSDVDGDSLTAILGTNVTNGSLTLNPDGSFTYTPNPGFAGIDSFTYTAHDGTTGSSSVTVTITVADTQPPTITASVAVSSLWPPNHDLVDVGLTYTATDNSSGVTTSVTVYSDEDDGATPDAVGSLLLRAERSGTGDGRVYLIVITATDAYGNTSQSCLTVVVPKSMSAAHVASVNAQAAAAQSACTGAGMFVVGE